ncbi:MAG: hypothetical protein AB7S38_25620 [Vulcanimicrobiota bacterium]
MSARFLLLFFLLSSLGLAQEWTTVESFLWPRGTTIQMRGRNLTILWRDGRPFVRTTEVADPLNLESDEEYVDLTLALARTGRKIRLLNGVVEIDSGLTSAPAASNVSYLGPVPPQDDEELAGLFEVMVERLDVDDQAVRAAIVIHNVSGATVSAKAVTCYFAQDGVAFLRQQMVLPSLAQNEKRALVFYGLHRGHLPAGAQPQVELRFSSYAEKGPAPSRAEKMMGSDRAKKTYSTRARSWKKF